MNPFIKPSIGYCAIFNDLDSDKIKSIVDENYDAWNESDCNSNTDSWDSFKNATEHSKQLLDELSEKTKLGLLYFALESELMIYPLRKA